MNLIISLILIALTVTAIRKYLKERKAGQETQSKERMDAFRKTMRDLYHR